MNQDASRPEPARTATVCSAKGCRARASYGLLWNNPKVHTPERRKTWLACEAHADSLSDFLSIRGFLKDAVAISELAAPVTDEADVTPETGATDEV